jgi:thymidylate synthase
MHRLVSAINALANIETVYVIGGECVYSRFLYHDITYDPALIDEIILGEISNWGTCEVCAKFSDWMLNKFTKVKVLDDCNIPLENGTNAKYTLTKYIRSTLHPEHKYINLIENIITNGDRRDQERTGTGTLSLFGQQLTINLTDGYCPVLHTRNMPTGSIVSEYKWYLSGSTNVDDLRKISGKQKTVWDANTSREFLDGVGLSHYSPGDIGPSYGFQFRHAGASYTKKDSNYATAGVDQIQNVIHSLKTNPHGRRHIISLWSVPDIDKMALPPCLRDYQFYIRKTLNSLGKLITVLDCKADQRSSDIFLAGYWNIYQVAYLIYYILEKINVSEAKTTNDNLIYPGRIIMNYGDVHVYTHQLDQCKRQIQLANNHTLEFYNVTSFSEDTGFKFSPEYNPLSKLTSAMAI